VPQQAVALLRLCRAVNTHFELLREVVPLLLILGSVVWGLVNARHRLRPWYVAIAGLGAVVSVPATLALLASARSGQFTGWGGLGMVILLLPAVFVAALSVTALATLAVLVPRYGFNTPSEAERAEERRRRHDPNVQRADALRKLKLTASMFTVVLLVSWLRGALR